PLNRFPRSVAADSSATRTPGPRFPSKRFWLALADDRSSSTSPARPFEANRLRNRRRRERVAVTPLPALPRRSLRSSETAGPAARGGRGAPARAAGGRAGGGRGAELAVAQRELRAAEAHAGVVRRRHGRAAHQWLPAASVERGAADGHEPSSLDGHLGAVQG